MKELKHILSYTRRAVADYNMISPGDKIAVGVSAGKDSLTLLYALTALRRFYPVPFDLVAVTIDMGFAGHGFRPDLHALPRTGRALPHYSDPDIAHHFRCAEGIKPLFTLRKNAAGFAAHSGKGTGLQPCSTGSSF